MRNVLKLGLMSLVLWTISTDQASASWDDTPPPDMVARIGRWTLPRLEKRWPDHPEWLAMFADILAGSQLGPEDGWFRKAKAQTRFDAKTLIAGLDKDGDGTIARGEFPGSDPDFRRLDRDGSGAISAADFEFSAHALTPTPGMMLFAMADRDGNGRVTPEEFDAFFKMLDSDSQGFLSQEDFQQLFASSGRRGGGGSSSSGPSRSTLIQGLFAQEIGSLQAGPRLGEFAPDFQLKTVDGKGAVTLSKLIGPKPVVLIFGNFTCGPFRMQGGNIEKLYEHYKDRAEFVMVYVREAHPKGGWVLPSNDRVGVSLDQPKTQDERIAVAQTCQRTLGFDMPFLVDTIDDAVGAKYSGMPSRLYLLDSEGKVAYKSGRGPFGFKPRELETSLVWLLNDQAQSRP